MVDGRFSFPSCSSAAREAGITRYHLPVSKPLPVLVTLGLVLATGVALELGVSQLYEAPTPMLDKSIEYNSLPHTEPEVVIFGTCLPEQILQLYLLEQELGMTSYNLATPAGTSRLMYLVLKNHIPEDSNVQAIVVPYGKRDLTKLMAPYESQVMEIAAWDDIPQLIDWACKDPECETEMWARKSSRAYRYRGYLANRFWQGIGSKPPIPGYVLSPGAVMPEGVGKEPPPNQTGGGAGGRQAGDSDTDLRYLAAFLELARDRGIPVVLTPLPERSHVGKGSPPESKEMRALFDETGAIYLNVGAVDGLSAGHFEDDVHLNSQGRVLVTKAIGEAVREHLAHP